MTQEPRYRRIAEELRHAITEHAYGPGGKLPSEGALAGQYEVSRGTIRQALMLLRQDGLVTSRRGTRRVVLDDAPVQDFAQMQSFARWARSIGETPEGRVVGQGWHPADPNEQRHLRIDADARVLHVMRLRLLSGRPAMLERTVYPELAGTIVENLASDTVSVTEFLESAGIFVADAEHTIDLVLAAPEDAELLGCAPGDPLLRERRRSTDPAGVPLEWSEDRYVPGSVAFVVHNSLASTPMTRQHMVPGNSGS
ncbi:transcriptional regulator, GntR family [Catenulispora acidiphila DSM 44928]|uniref:Transcriptional regulator, GntR family n=1 Tax=Catenulispora acidiphila (strain DSM 44928 / JCM 14897 / NBRC 102108 / NRRL B-24433 / ID139908) TaxID=479433 RepID=C7Q7P7_CATAD|nr:GntR family transcriptional regulator [Catenulispora acidiphila]ACU72240.1 transcriptional regulator, GntR family [Catenulispora acidiphila DSM 44928]